MPQLLVSSAGRAGRVCHIHGAIGAKLVRVSLVMGDTPTLTPHRIDGIAERITSSHLCLWTSG
jgi:hypothetical protein